MASLRVAFAQPVEPAPAEPAEVPSVPAPEPEFDPTKPQLERDLPSPDRASGIVVEEPAGGKLRWIPRVLLFVPRWTLWTIAQPARLGAYLYERYQIVDRIQGVFFSSDGTYGLFPTGAYTTDFGLNLGLRFVHENLFGRREYLRTRVNFGNEIQYGFGFQLRSGNRFGKRIAVGLEAQYEQRPSERFFGIGNENELAVPPMMPIDPSLADVALSSRFRQNWYRTVIRSEAIVRGPLSVRSAGALAVREFRNFEEPDPAMPTNEGIEQRFDTTKLIGYDRGVKNIYAELQVVYDSRRQTSPWQSLAVDSTGWYAALHGGRAFGIDGDPTAFWRYGFEVQRPIDLYRGSRVLMLRAHLDAISGGDGRNDETVSFIDLPRLGGTDFLRGYPAHRFRDRAVALVTAEYSWDLGNFLAAFTFIDVGRAFRTLEAFTPHGAHVGFGGGVQFHTNRSFLMRLQLAGSREGSVFFEAVFAPAFGRRERAGRF